ncbi:MAG: alpha-L-fucosidase [Clostridia bacterium]|nr:alpha-L-fucosidase [Clostridia bacterium]
MNAEEHFGIKPYGATPTYRQIEHLKLGRKAFFHFGVNTFSNMEWGDGTERESLFNPTDIDVRSWIRDIKAAGFELAIITAKHHDGFCLWPSKYTEHSVKNSPYKNGEGDIIREFTDACHEYNMKVGIYVSPWDRNSPYWGSPEYSEFYAKQLEEILTGYGKIDEIWWDGAGSLEAKYDWGRWAYLIRKHQPDAVIFGSMGAYPYAEMRWVGNEAGFAGLTHYASINRDMIEQEIVEHMNAGIIGGELYIPAEVDVSIRPGWFYHEDQDDKVKSSRALDKIWFRSVGNNAIMLLNFPPDRRGKLVRTDVKNAIESYQRISRMLSVNLLAGASLTADSSYCADTGIDKAAAADYDLYYASGADRSEAVVDIALESSTRANTLIIGEMVELGERITSYKLESIEGNTVSLLAEGTSVGFKRAIRFTEGDYSHLRLAVSGIVAPITLNTLSLHLYEADENDSTNSQDKPNLARLSSASVEISEDRKSAVILFGGIYPFDSIAFVSTNHMGARYEIFAFDGSKYYSIAEGKADDYNINVKLDSLVETSYQVKIVSDSRFAIDPDFNIH